jgi:hypothetical protein
VYRNVWPAPDLQVDFASYSPIGHVQLGEAVDPAIAQPTDEPALNDQHVPSGQRSQKIPYDTYAQSHW